MNLSTFNIRTLCPKINHLLAGWEKMNGDCRAYSFYKVKEMISNGSLSVHDEDPNDMDDDESSVEDQRTRKILI